MEILAGPVEGFVRGRRQRPVVAMKWERKLWVFRDFLFILVSGVSFL